MTQSNIEETQIQIHKNLGPKKKREVVCFWLPQTTRLLIMVEFYISFDRCEDKVRYSFISHLSAAFHRRGISSFVGGSDPEADGSSKPCLEKSKACVVVFSEQYSSSKPCLEELVKVTERRRNDGGLAVVPVFYRATKSSVKKLIWKSNDLTNEWRSALLQVVDLPGHESHATQRSFPNHILYKKTFNKIFNVI